MNTTQKQKIAQMQGILGVKGGESTLYQILNKNSWDVNTAIDVYFANGYADKMPSSNQMTGATKGKSSFNESNAASLFSKFNNDG